MTRSTTLLLAAFASWALAGCEVSAVGDPCVPQAIPAGGFREQDIVIETTSVMCRTRVCLVYGFTGDPTHEYVSPTEHTCDLDAAADAGSPGDPLADPLCRTREDIRESVYCSCRCDSTGDTNVPLCDCPSGFSCVALQEGGGAGVEGSYCVRGRVRDGG